MKKVLSALIVLAMFAVFAGCNKEEAPTQGDAEVAKSAQKSDAAAGKNSVGGGGAGPMAPPDPSGP